MYKDRHAPVLLVILDGVGEAPPSDTNAVWCANTPVLDWIRTLPTYCQLKAHGTAVGMPTDDDMGNSEVGHNTLGAGRIFKQGAALVDSAIRQHRIFDTAEWQQAIDRCQQGGVFHLIGLLSDGNVHSHIDHTIYLIELAAQSGVTQLRCHVLLDGRDVAARSALGYIQTLDAVLQRHRDQGLSYWITSGGGRMVTTMDRYQADWSIVERGWHAHVLGTARPFSSATEAIHTFYQADPQESDQTLPAFTIVSDSGPIGPIEDGDVVLITNFRGDRVIELTQAFEDPQFSGFDRVRIPNVHLIGMMQYDGDLNIPRHFLVSPPQIEGGVADVMAQASIRSFAISETQKYGHVTYFWNGNRSGKVAPHLETYVEIPSDRIVFDQAPDMKAREITAKTIQLIESGHYRFGRVNFPNGDMVGHTGNLAATIQSIETVDACLGQLIAAMDQVGGVTVVVADHGNADDMGQWVAGAWRPKTAHTLNPVPFAVVDSQRGSRVQLATVPTPGLSNVAATVLVLLGIAVPDYLDPPLITVLP